MNVKIERAKESDYDRVLAVMKPWNMHHVPSEEMEELEMNKFFVAKIDGKIVGASGYKMIAPDKGKTTLLGVLPEYSGYKIGRKLQDARINAMYELGAKKVITNADRPETIRWYKKNYGYYEIGTEKKLHSFGLDSVDHWTTLEMDLDEYFESHE